MTDLKEGVFHIYGSFTYKEAQAIVRKLKCNLASWRQMKDAYKHGANWCDYGWSKEQQAYYPIQKGFYDKLKEKGHENNCGKPGLNGGYFRNKNLKFGINCYGLRPNLFDFSNLNNLGINNSNIDYVDYENNTTNTLNNTDNANNYTTPFNNNGYYLANLSSSYSCSCPAETCTDEHACNI